MLLRKHNVTQGGRQSRLSPFIFIGGKTLIYIKIINLLIFFSIFVNIKPNIFIIIILTIFFSIINSMKKSDLKLYIDKELLIFQIITSFFLYRKTNFFEIDMKSYMFYFYNYVKLLFLGINIAMIIYFFKRKTKDFYYYYFYIIFLFLLIFENRFDISFLSLLEFFIHIIDLIYSQYLLDLIMLFIIIKFCVVKKSKNSLYLFLLLNIYIKL